MKNALPLALCTSGLSLIALACSANFGGPARSNASFSASTPVNKDGGKNGSGSGDGQGSGDGANDGGSGTDGSGKGGNGGLGDSGDTGLPPNINFGMLVNDLNCTVCHLEVHGTVISIGDAAPLRADSNGKVFGKWLVGGAYHAADQVNAAPRLGGLAVTLGVTPNYDNAGKELPVAPGTTKPAFPGLDFAVVAAKAAGTVSSSATAYSLASATKVHPGNAVLIGTASHPITIDKDVLIQGDLIIAGVYTGVGTLYVSGNIYIPSNLTALHLASFPYSDDPAAGNAQGAADVKGGGKDGLGLASGHNIFIGDLENYMDAANGTADAKVPAGAHGPRLNSLYTPVTGADAQPNFFYTANGVWDVYNWFPETRYEQLYSEVTPCWTAASARSLVSGHHWGERTWNQIDAYLYAASNIGGIDRASNWTLNGGMIAQTMHIISGADSERIGGNTPCGANRINFDYRMQNNLKVLERLTGQFAPK